MSNRSSGTSGDLVPSSSSAIDKLPEETLLEVFDFYRQQFKRPSRSISFSNPHRQESKLVPIYERGWNREFGWFNLVHVCQKWRRIVLAAPSRLDLSFVLIANNPGRIKTILSPRLPPLPIRIDHVHGDFTHDDLGRVVATLKHRDRVRGIVFEGLGAQLEMFFKAVRSSHFLERLEIRHHGGSLLELPPRFLRGSAPYLRRLELCTVSLASISQLLSSATSLVELSLGLDCIFGTSPTVSLVAYLQAMPCLRWLALRLREGNPPANIQAPSMKPETVVPLSKLKFFHFHGRRAFFEVLLAGLAAPSLQAFDIELLDYNNIPPICHLGRFITEIEALAEDYAFRVVCSFSFDHLFSLSLATRSERIDDPEPHFKFYSRDIIQIGNALSPKLAAVEELFLDSVSARHTSGSTPWRRFLELFHSVKILSVDQIIALDVVHSLQQEPGMSAVVLPSLEELRLCSKSSSYMTRSNLVAFKPFVAARKQAGRPVKLSWNKVSAVDWNFPRYCWSQLSEWAFMVRCDSSLKNPVF